MLKDIKNLVFDLDDTLYSKSLGICKTGWQRLENVFRSDKKYEFDIGHLTYEDYERHGDKILRAEKNFKWDEFMSYICSQDVSSIDYNEKLVNIFNKLSHKKYIYTNAEKNHMDRVIKQLGVSGMFENKFTSKEGNYFFKPEKESFDMFFKFNNINPIETAFFEDNLKNLEAGKKIGMTTFLISEEEIDKPEYCDFVFKDIVSALSIF